MDKERVNEIARQLVVIRALRARTIAVVVQDAAELMKRELITENEYLKFVDAIYEEFAGKALEEYEKIIKR